jgi:hypothetical protein
MGIRPSSSRGSEKERIPSGTNEAIAGSLRAVTHQESAPTRSTVVLSRLTHCFHLNLELLGNLLNRHPRFE